MNEHLEETIRLSRKAYAARRKMRRLGAAELVMGQLRFVARPVWLLQGILLICICVLVSLNRGAASLCAVLVAMTALPFCGRSRKYKMQEIEATARLSRARQLLARLAAIALGDLVCLLVLSLISAAPMEVILPFLLATVGSLLVLDCELFDPTGLCIGIGVIYSAPATRALLAELSTGTELGCCIALTIALALLLKGDRLWSLKLEI